MFGVLLVLVPPAIGIAIELLVGLASEQARRVVHLVFVGGLSAVVFVQALKKAIDAGDTVLIVLSLALGVAVAVLYQRAEPVRSFLSVLSPAPILFLVLFLFFSDVSKIVIPEDASAKSAEGVARVPVVMVVFDEFPSTSLLDEKGGIDAKRYPSFARLAKDATFFKNAHSVYDSTSRAVPAIMDGNKPVIDRRLPTASEHPNSIFTLLGKSHTMNVSEEATSVCPRDLCEDARLDEPFVDRLKSMTEDIGRVYAHVVAPPGIEEDLPTVSESWGDFGGGGEGGAASSRAHERRPAGHAREPCQRPQGPLRRVGGQHPQEAGDAELQARAAAPRAVAVPARRAPVPARPRSSRSRRSPARATRTRARSSSFSCATCCRPASPTASWARCWTRLEQRGLYDDALIVVVADHGVSFKKGQFDRRDVNRGNIDEITPVPLLIKQPKPAAGQCGAARSWRPPMCCPPSPTCSAPSCPRRSTAARPSPPRSSGARRCRCSSAT